MKGVSITSTRPDYEKVVYKAADQTRTSTTTLADDADLVVAVVANGVYAVDGVLLVNGHGTPDYKYGMAVPSGAAFDGKGMDSSVSGGNWDSFSEAASVTCATDSSDGAVPFSGVLTVGGTAGNIALQWAQAVSDVNNTTTKKGSWMRVRRLT